PRTLRPSSLSPSLLLLLRPPRSTLFPYTTLFRSNQLTAHDLLNSQIPHALLKGALGMRNAIVHDYLNLDWTRIEAVLVNKHYQADRKSTRLNSSHVKISYAVFCLKKKNNK